MDRMKKARAKKKMMKSMKGAYSPSTEKAFKGIEMTPTKSFGRKNRYKKSPEITGKMDDLIDKAAEAVGTTGPNYDRRGMSPEGLEKKSKENYKKFKPYFSEDPKKRKKEMRRFKRYKKERMR